MANPVDKELVQALKQARGGTPMQFAFLPKAPGGKLLVGRKVPPKKIADTKKQTGAASIIKGRCIGEEGTLVFEVVKEPPATLVAQLKRSLKEDAGLTLPVEIRVKADAEAEPEEGVPKVNAEGFHRGARRERKEGRRERSRPRQRHLGSWSPRRIASLSFSPRSQRSPR